MPRYTHIDREYGFPAGTMDSLARQENPQNDPNAVSPRGARGLMQVMPDTRPEIMHESGHDPWSSNPEESVRAGAHYLRKQLNRFGNLPMALAAYNTGGGNVSQAVRNHGSAWLANLSRETRNYVPSILRRAGLTDSDIAGAEAYEQRRSNHQTTTDEDREQDERLRAWGRRLGVPDKLLEVLDGNKLFQFLLLTIVAMAQSAGHGLGAAAQIASGGAPQHVADGSHVSPTHVPQRPANPAPTRHA